MSLKHQGHRERRGEPADSVPLARLGRIGTDAVGEHALVSQAEAEAGTATSKRIWTAERVAQAIAALSTGGSGSVSLSYFIGP